MDGGAKEVLPGVRVFTGGKHTYGSQYLGVQTSSGTVVLASDNAYLYENLEKRLQKRILVQGKKHLHIEEFELKFHILIDEEGRTYPLAIIESPFPALSAEFLDYASKVRFTPPTRLGIPVRTEYLWPVKIKR